MVFFFEKNPMTNKIKKFLYILEHLIPDGYDEIPTFALYHPLLVQLYNIDFKHKIKSSFSVMVRAGRGVTVKP